MINCRNGEGNTINKVTVAIISKLMAVVIKAVTIKRDAVMVLK